MATREEITMALDALRVLNQMGQQLRSIADGVLQQDNRLQAIVGNSGKLAKLTNGLQALQLDVAVLNSDRTTIKNIAQYILDNVPEMTKI